MRFAPSPTGHLHIGGLRAALFNWLFARHLQGTYLLRIEDTDVERSKQEYTDAIMQAFSWVNLEPDEKPVIQSTRIAEHQAVINKLIDEGKAYRCYCPARGEVSGEIEYKKYDRRCRNLRDGDPTKTHVVRFAVPDNVTHISWDDLIRGPILFQADELDDFVIARSTGMPMYNFVVVVDDAHMAITHVIRGEEHISNTPKQILLYQACGYTIPQFAHLPVILNAQGQKLSKRDGATAVIDYKKMGYLPDALVNYLVRLGWSHGDQEIFTRQELISLFTLEAVGKKGAIFDPAKLDWTNSVYMRQMSDDDLLNYIIREFEPNLKEKAPLWREDQLLMFIKLYKERTKTLRELVDELYAVYKTPTMYVPSDVETYVAADTAGYLRQLAQTLEALDGFGVDLLADTIKVFCKQHSIKLVQIAQPLRLALVGKATSPGVFELLALIGSKESLNRLHTFMVWLEKR